MAHPDAGNQKPEYCKELLSHRTVAGFSDGGAHTKFQTLGAYVTDLLTWMVRDTETITLEQAQLSSELSAGLDGGVQGSWLSAGRPGG